MGFSWGSRDSYPTVWVATQPSSLRSPAGYSGPDLTLSKAACSSPSLPCLQVEDAIVWAAAALGVSVRHLICGISLFIYFSFRLFCPLRFQISPQTHQREFPGVWKILFFKAPFPRGISIPTSFVSLFIFDILSYLLSKTMGCLFGCLMYSASIQEFFCGICSVFKCCFHKFVGEKVVSPSYSSSNFESILVRFSKKDCENQYVNMLYRKDFY